MQKVLNREKQGLEIWNLKKYEPLSRDSIFPILGIYSQMTTTKPPPPP